MTTDERGSAGASRLPSFGLIVVGDEILSGKRTDRHFPRVIELLGARGLRLGWTQFLPDERAALVAAFKRSFGSDDVVFACGGIGSTPDDHTRQAAALALGVDLVLHPQAAAEIVARCAELGQPDMSTPENRQRLTMGEFPRGARIIANPYNRIPGFAIARHYFVPGFPVMAWPMIEAVLEADFRPYFHALPMEERSLLLFETPESAIVPLMHDVEARFSGVKAFSLPSVGVDADGRPERRHIELGVKGPPDLVGPAFEFVHRRLSEMKRPFQL